MRYLLTIPLLLVVSFVLGQTSPLFKITQNDKTGYINNKGKIVIKPIFLNGSDFSEGLAAVRLNGYYGFIDKTGRFVIPAKYDYAQQFSNGIAAVHKDGIPFFINKKEEIVLPMVYKTLSFLDDRKALVTTLTNKQGVIDIHSKQLIIDTAFLSIEPFECGVAIVSELPPAGKRNEYNVGVIDTTGKILVPFGKYNLIETFKEGFATVDIRNTGTHSRGTDAVIDTKGNCVLERPHANNTYISGDFYDGYAQISLYKYWIPEKTGTYGSSDKSYPGYINLKGEVVFDDTTYSEITDFSAGRAFIKRKDDDYILINKDFKRVGHEKFKNVSEQGFQKGYAIVETNTGCGIIDTSGKFVVQPQFEEIDETGIIDDYFFYSKEMDVEDDEEEEKILFGIADLSGKTITKARMQYFDRTGFHNGLLKAIVKDKLTYIDRKGTFVWKEKKSKSNGIRRMNIDYMNRGYFMAYSTAYVEKYGTNSGWAVSENAPDKIADSAFPENKLAVVIDTTHIDTFQHQFSGFGLFISNTTADTIKFNAQDSRLYMKLQAQNSKGQWLDIEYLPNSWCGNSYHKVELEPNAFWRFVIPDYEGEVRTKIRAALEYIDKDNPQKSKVVYSNEISGSINPAQFWNKMPYYPNNLMDPYNE